MGIFITLILSAFFSGIEIAFYSSNKLRVELRKGKGTVSSKFMTQFYDYKSRFISTLLVGNNIALVVFGSLMAAVLSPEMFHFLGSSLSAFFAQEPMLLVFQTIVSTIVILIFGEFIPKVLFKISPSRILYFFAVPLKIISVLLQPITWAFDRMARFLIKFILGREYTEESHEFSAIDLEHFIKQSSSSAEDKDEDEEDELNTDILEKALYLRDVKVKECMIPRMDIKAVEVDASIDELKKMFVETGLSRIILYRESIDNIKGYTHHFELLKEPRKIQSIMFTLPVVPESMSARDLLTLFTRENRSIAWVVDEYGGTAGIVTLEDVMEEIFGEIKDEHDTEDYVEKQLSETEFIFSGRLETDYINEKYNLAIPSGDYETIAGYVVSTHEDIPETGEEIQLDNYNIKILKATDNKIDTLHLRVLGLEDE